MKGIDTMKIIAVSTRNEFFGGQKRYFCNQAYIDRIQKEGALPIIITDIKYMDKIADLCDGLIITGGNDIDPQYYHQDKHPLTLTYDEPIDELDMAAMRAFVKKDKPILGICRGIQVFNVYFNGSLIQHFDSKPHESIKENTHIVNQVHPSFLSDLYSSTFEVNSFHHQCIDTLGDDLIICAKADDGIIEAVCHKDKPLFAVQWHPEKIENDKVIPYFIRHIL